MLITISDIVKDTHLLNNLCQGGKARRLKINKFQKKYILLYDIYFFISDDPNPLQSRLVENLLYSW